MYVSSAIGVWLFYVQHQFEHMHWYEDEHWDFFTAAVLGSSYYHLPRPLNWLTGNIGIHHVHHLALKVPNYRLQACLGAIPELRDLNRISISESLACVRLKLWDEEQRRLVPFP
jgi:omega-6 fatty acid desaturase (delta-12 desaturase)